MTKHAFLSDDWFAAVRGLQAEHTDAVPPGISVRMNLNITGMPSDGDRRMHMTTRDGTADWGEGLLPEADVTLTLGYDVAKEMFVAGNPQVAVEAFLAGRIVIQGDLTRLMELQAAPPPAGAPAFARALQDMTE